MIDTAQWLSDIGLGQYITAFTKNGVDGRALPYLTEQDLREMGVLLGHRRVLLAAIAALSAPAAASEAERRSLTVMFCDLVGSTRLSSRLDVEDYRQIIGTYQRACADVIAGHDGYLAKYMGDGLLVYFGYPVAHDDDARRAVHAARAIVAAMPALDVPTDEPLAVRIGIATGEVVVGDVVGHGAAEERTVLGATPNLAARLQAIAGENDIVVSDTTRQLLHDDFAVADLGTHALKGIPGATQAWRITGLALREHAAPDTTPFVGRTQELAQVRDAWTRAAAGHLEAIAVIGQPGIGKSRFVAEVAADLRPAATLALSCSALHRNTPLHPLPPEFIDHGGGPETTGADQRQAIFDAVVAELDRQATAAPLLIVVEDAHCIDPTTAELLAEISRRLAARPILLIVAGRPGDTADDLAGAVGATRIDLEALTASEATALAAAVGPAMSQQDRQNIVDRAGGLPLFIEELTRVVSHGDTTDVPASLQESLLARLDALGPAKRIAQLASVFGQRFQRDDLAALLGPDDPPLDPALHRLMDAGLLVHVEPGCAFRHALFRDTAYDTLLRATRRTMHGTVADHLIGRTPPAEPEVIAGHLAAADRNTEAAAYWHRAGQRSAALWAHTEAAAYYEAALQDPTALGGDADELALRLDLVESLRITDRYDDALAQLTAAEAIAQRVATDADWLRLHVLRGNIYFPLGDADRCIEANQAALAVARRMADPAAEARALSGIADAHFAGHRIATAEQAYGDCIAIAQTHGLNAIALANLSLRGHMRVYLCRMADARDDCEQAVAMAVAAGNRRAEVTARGSCLGKVLFEAAEYEAADRQFAIAGQLAADLGARRYEALNLIFRAMVALETGDRPAALEISTNAAVISREIGQRFCLPMALGVIARATDDADRCRAHLAEAEQVIAAGAMAHNPLWFYRQAALTAIERRSPTQARRYAQALRDAFAEEPLPWATHVANGADALAANVETNDRHAADAAITEATAAGMIAWAQNLASVADANSGYRSPG